MRVGLGFRFGGHAGGVRQVDFDGRPQRPFQFGLRLRVFPDLGADAFAEGEVFEVERLAVDLVHAAVAIISQL